MPRRTHREVEFGDFQTPDELAFRICKVLHRLGVSPHSIVEPTCGTGSFLRSSIVAFPQCPSFLGFEVNPEYARVANTIERADVSCENFFEKDWPGTLSDLPEPILVIGNPPWVTNSVMGSLEGANLPVKSNFKHLGGLDAITGKSNFDISEWILTYLLESLSGRKAVLAMLCKTSVARKVLHYAWNRNLQVRKSAIYSIDASTYFGVAVDACLLVCILEPEGSSQECVAFRYLEAPAPDSKIAFRNGRLVADLDAFDTYSRLLGTSSLKWRSGVKHDCSRVIELRPKGYDRFENGFGEVVSLESTHLYPMLKGSELVKSHPNPSRYMLVTQRSMGDDTSRIERDTPQTWSYLQEYGEWFDGRASSIYRNRPRFSVFGIGPYSFAPWKVAVSGFHKRLEFRCIGPVDGKPVMLDDTCYFLPCQTELDARLLAELLNSETAIGFFRSFIFWDTKRPITAQLLAGLDIEKLAEEAHVSLPLWTDDPRQDSDPLGFQQAFW